MGIHLPWGTGQVLEGGHTRRSLIKYNGVAHRSLVESFTFPCKVGMAITDRQEGQYQKPKSYVAVNVGREILLEALTHLQELIYHDGRHQIWILGLQGEQIILDELGMIYLYPDDFRFRDVLEENGIAEKPSSDTSYQTMSQRDYVMVNFSQQMNGQHCCNRWLCSRYAFIMKKIILLYEFAGDIKIFEEYTLYGYLYLYV